MNAVLVQDWLLREMTAYGLIEKQSQDHVFSGDANDFRIEVVAVPIPRYTRFREPAPDFGPDYN